MNEAPQLLRQMAQVPGLTLYGPDPAQGHHRAALVAFTHESVHPSDLATFLDQDGIAVRAGHHCTQPLHKRLGADGGTVRASLALYNTEAEVEAFLAALDRVLADLEDDSDFVEDVALRAREQFGLGLSAALAELARANPNEQREKGG